MNRRLFLYKLLTALKNNKVMILDSETLYNKLYIFNSILKGYKLPQYTYNKNEEFITDLLLAFTDFNMGIYTYDHKLLFSDEPSMEEKICKFSLNDVSDKLINEIAMIFAFEIREDKINKRLLNK